MADPGFLGKILLKTNGGSWISGKNSVENQWRILDFWEGGSKSSTVVERTPQTPSESATENHYLHFNIWDKILKTVNCKESTAVQMIFPLIQ